MNYILIDGELTFRQILDNGPSYSLELFSDSRPVNSEKLTDKIKMCDRTYLPVSSIPVYTYLKQEKEKEEVGHLFFALLLVFSYYLFYILKVN